MIENVHKKYASIEELHEDEGPFTQSLMKEEMEKVIEKFSNKKKGKEMCKFENLSRRRTVTHRILLFKI